jgi:hypothetical protein
MSLLITLWVQPKKEEQHHTAQKGRTDVVYMIFTVLFSIKEERFEPIKLAKPLRFY